MTSGFAAGIGAAAGDAAGIVAAAPVRGAAVAGDAAGIVAAGLAAAADAVAIPGIAAIAAGLGYANVTSIVARPLGPGRSTACADSEPAEAAMNTTIESARERFIVRK